MQTSRTHNKKTFEHCIIKTTPSIVNNYELAYKQLFNILVTAWVLNV